VARLISGAYHAYMRSDAWKEKRLEYAKHGPYHGQCYVCGWRHGLQVHHMTYERCGHEDLWDLRHLCGTCHRTVAVITRSCFNKDPGRATEWLRAYVSSACHGALSRHQFIKQLGIKQIERCAMGLSGTHRGKRKRQKRNKKRKPRPTPKGWGVGRYAGKPGEHIECEVTVLESFEATRKGANPGHSKRHGNQCIYHVVMTTSSGARLLVRQSPCALTRVLVKGWSGRIKAVVVKRTIHAKQRSVVLGHVELSHDNSTQELHADAIAHIAQLKQIAEFERSISTNIFSK